MPRVGVVVGLASEARLLRGVDGLEVACSGASAERARRLAGNLLDAGCDALASFGLAGGLDPVLPSGGLVLPTAVLTPSGTHLPADGLWRMRLLARLGLPDRPALLAGRNEAVASPEEKQALFTRTGASAIDMESHAMAEVAHARSIPFLVIRAIADPTDRRLPSWLAGVIGESGRPRMQVLLNGLVAHPLDLADLIRLAGDAGRGMATLRRVAAGAGPLLAFRA